MYYTSIVYCIKLKENMFVFAVEESGKCVLYTNSTNSQVDLHNMYNGKEMSYLSPSCSLEKTFGDRCQGQVLPMQ